MKKYYSLGLALLAAPTLALALATQYYCPASITAKIHATFNSASVQVQNMVGTARPFLPFTKVAPYQSTNKLAKSGTFLFTFDGVYYANNPPANTGPTGCYYINTASHSIVLEFDTAKYTPLYDHSSKWTSGYNPMCTHQPQPWITPTSCPLILSTAHTTQRSAR